jgi:hypothetical protein
MRKKLFIPVLAGLSLASALGLSRVSANQPDIGQNSPAMWRAWRPIVTAFGNGDPKSAVSYLLQASKIVRQADAKLARDEKTEEFRTEAIKSMKNFDLKGFMELLPYPEGEFKGFAFLGKPGSKSYDVKAVDPTSGTFKEGSRNLPFGSSYGHVKVKKIEHESERRYHLHLSGATGMGPLTWESFTSGLIEEGKLLEITDSQLPIVMQAAMKFVGSRQGGLGEKDRRLLASGWGSFPTVGQMLLPISRIEDIVDEAAAKEGVRSLQVIAKWDLPSMKTRYPHFAKYWDALDNIADAHFRVDDATGGHLISMDLNSERTEIKVRGHVKDGRLVVKQKDGSFQPAQMERMKLTQNLYFNLHRIKLHIENLQVDVSYRPHQNGMRLYATTTRVPKITVGGAAFGLLPTKVLDWFIPGDTESLARRLFEVAAKGNGGKGAVFDATFSEGSQGATVDIKYDVEVLDSSLIRFCVAIIADASIPDDDTEEDMIKFSVDYRNAFDKDVNRFAQYGTEAVFQNP